jgi:hypothetical protein
VAKNKEPKVKKERFKTLKQIGQTYTITRKSDKALPWVILGTIIAFSAKFVSYKETFAAPDMPWDSFVLSSVLSLFLFNGYDFLVKISDESADPENNKIALIASISITTLIYIAIIISGLCVLHFKTASTTFNIITKLYEVLTNKMVANIVFIVGDFNFSNLSLTILSLSLLGLSSKAK